MARYTFLYKVQGIGVHGGLPWGLQPCMNDYLGFRFHTAAWILSMGSPPSARSTAAS